MKRILFLFAALLFYAGILSAQSISGNVNSSKSKRSLDYANVNIYKNGKLVANVLTDEMGNFKVNLDTGVYDCEIVYAGYEKEVKKIEVKSDEKADFLMAGDATSKYSAERIAESREISRYTNSSPLSGIVASSMWGAVAKEGAVVSGKLTAGEINDFSKWKMWTDLNENELKANLAYWNFSPNGRYVAQVKDQNGLPLANAKVELMCDTKVVFTSRSDNTGKAELWESFLPDTVKANTSYSLRVTYNGEILTKQRAKEINRGINSFEFNAPCNQSQNVDIAVVVDATGSMQDEIDYLKSDLNDVIFRSKEISTTLNLSFANIFYRDISDTYVVKSQDFTNVLSESVAFTTENNAAGGGDEPESVEIALDSAINKLKWREDTRAKIIFLVLDAPPHNTPTILEKLRTLCSQAAEKGIRIVPVTGSGTSKNAEYIMRCIALATNGTYTFLTNHSAIGNTHIEPTTDNYQVEVLNDLLIRIIKAYSYMPDCRQVVAEMGVNLPDSQIVINVPVDSSGTGLTGTDPSDVTNPTDSVTLEWKYYPNPTDGLVTIVSNVAIDELYISDLSGKALQVLSDIKPGEPVTADLSEYASGIYLIRYPYGKQWVSGKISLQRSF